MQADHGNARSSRMKRTKRAAFCSRTQVSVKLSFSFALLHTVPTL